MSWRQRRETGETSDKRTKQHQAHSTTKTDAINFYFFSFLLSLLICSQFRWNVICVSQRHVYTRYLRWRVRSIIFKESNWGWLVVSERKWERRNLSNCVVTRLVAGWYHSSKRQARARAYSETDRLSYRVGSRLDTTFDRLRPKASEQIMTSSGFKGGKNGDDPLSEKRVWIFHFNWTVIDREWTCDLHTAYSKTMARDRF